MTMSFEFHSQVGCRREKIKSSPFINRATNMGTTTKMETLIGKPIINLSTTHFKSTKKISSGSSLGAK